MLYSCIGSSCPQIGWSTDFLAQPGTIRFNIFWQIRFVHARNAPIRLVVNLYSNVAELQMNGGYSSCSPYCTDSPVAGHLEGPIDDVVFVVLRLQPRLGKRFLPRTDTPAWCTVSELPETSGCHQ